MIGGGEVCLGHRAKTEKVWTMPILPRKPHCPYIFPLILSHFSNSLLPYGRLRIIREKLGYQRKEIVPAVCQRVRYTWTGVRRGTMGMKGILPYVLGPMVMSTCT